MDAAAEFSQVSDLRVTRDLCTSRSNTFFGGHDMSANYRSRSSRSIGISAFALAATLGMPVAHAQTVVNNQSVTVPPFVIPFNDDLIVGSTATGSVTVTNATVFVNDVTLGDAASGNGTLTLNGALAALSVAGEYKIGNNGTGTFNILNGAGAQTSYGATIGSQPGSTGTATVSGPGSFWTDVGTVYVGGQGVGTMTVSDGGQFNGASIVVGSSTGSAGTFTLTGIGSAVNLSSNLYVGDDGNGTFNVVNGATLDVDGSLYVGYGDSQSFFNVSGGSTVTSGDVVLGYYSDNGKGTANISGAGTTWAIDGDLTIGDEGGAGEVNITAGAHVSVTGNLEMSGYDEGITRGDLLVSGTGTQLTVDGDTYIGERRDAVVTVTNGASMETGGDVFLGYDATGSGTLNISGSTTQWAGNQSIYVGYGGTGVLNINGGMVFDPDNNYLNVLYISYASGSEGTANISGAGTVVTIDN